MWGATILAALALAISGFALVGPNAQLGAAPGPDVYQHTIFHNSLTTGGTRATSTDDTTATLLASDLRDVARIDFTPNVPSITLTLPATSTLSDFVPRAGMSREVLLCNATTTAAAAFTLAFGVGMDDNLATSTLGIQQGDCAQLLFSRAPNSDIDVFYDLGF